MSEPLAYTVDEAAEASRRSRRALYRHIKSGALVARKDGAKTIILAADLRAWLEALPRMQTGANAQ
ncbi:MAG TPA: helix-turn-helix domain-containing protein [Ferrovibrio sp.]|uniref:helix-turn-helix domain-containing protein n=1 Tax=Ferrovibrio sp. TaxID=1917215 RepID=UPI002ED2F1D6